MIGKLTTSIRTYVTSRKVWALIQTIPDVLRSISGKKVKKLDFQILNNGTVKNIVELA